MGYYNYQNGLIYNHLSQKGGWDSHFEHCRNFIMRALDLYKPQKVTILGSGWLLELSLAEMIEKTKKVCLVDIVHPPDVMDQAGSLKNVELIEQDITGGLIEDVWQETGKYSFFKKLRSLENISIPEYSQEGDPGLIFSLNILTQLESLLIDFIKERSKIREEEFTGFRAEIQKKHIDFLKKHESVLITDLSEIITDNSGRVTEEITMLTDLPAGKYREEWIWNFDYARSDFHTKRSVFKIVGIVM